MGELKEVKMPARPGGWRAIATLQCRRAPLSQSESVDLPASQIKPDLQRALSLSL